MDFNCPSSYHLTTAVSRKEHPRSIVRSYFDSHTRFFLLSRESNRLASPRSTQQNFGISTTQRTLILVSSKRFRAVLCSESTRFTLPSTHLEVSATASLIFPGFLTAASISSWFQLFLLLPISLHRVTSIVSIVNKANDQVASFFLRVTARKGK